MAEEDVAEKSEKAGLGDKVKDLITKIKSSKKMMIIAGSGALLILLIIGGATYTSSCLIFLIIFLTKLNAF